MNNIGLIIDNNRIAKWQIDSLLNIKDLINISVIYNCENSFTSKNYFKYFMYYLFNFFFIKSRLTKNYSINKTFKNIKIINFNSKLINKWEHLPPHIIDEIKNKKINIIIKFGMNLLKIDDNLKDVKILSFHHGDPSKYRGRPAVFYEMLNKEKYLGTIVQSLNNKIDSGQIYGFAKTPLYKYSYSKTYNTALKNSKNILKDSLRNVNNNSPISINYSSSTYILPKNIVVIKFLLKLFRNFFHRLIYGLFFNKIWNSSIQDTEFQNIIKNNEFILKIEKNLDISSKKYSFYADPFFLDKDNILLEAFNHSTNKGEIVSYNISKNILNQIILSDSKKHFSYPQVIKYNEDTFIFPEVSSWSNPFFYSIINKKFYFLKGLELEKLVDATYFYYDNCHYIFAGKKEDSLFNLNIFYSKDHILGKYHNHPMNPVISDPSLSRMAGNIVIHNKQKFRLGQNCSEDYGNSIYVSKIIKLTPSRYFETKFTNIKVLGYKGPHTLNFKNNKIVYDFYKDEFNFFAWYKRIKNYLLK